MVMTNGTTVNFAFERFLIWSRSTFTYGGHLGQVVIWICQEGVLRLFSPRSTLPPQLARVLSPGYFLFGDNPPGAMKMQ
jgi:hypothetical protein